MPNPVVDVATSDKPVMNIATTNGGGGGGVTSVTASSPVVSSGGATPNISLNVPLSGSNTGDVSLTTIGSTPNNNGASLTGQQLRLQPADATHGGVITTGAQIFNGIKTFVTAIATSITNVALGGAIRLADGQFINWRNGANTGDATLQHTGNQFQMNDPLTVLQTLTIQDDNSGQVINITSPTLTGDLNLILPAIAGLVGQFLETDGAGNLSWASPVFPTIYYHYPVVAGVVENDIVMNATNTGTLVAPLAFKQAVNGDDNYYGQIYGVAKNVSGGFADIYLGIGSVIPGFSFGAFIGVDYYIDPANPGKLTFTPPATGSSVNPIKVGRALDSTNLLLFPISQFVQEKGALYTSDGSYDITVSPGANGQIPVYDSTTASGIKPGAAIVATTPFTFTSATRTLTIATATNSVAGVLSAADHTTFAAKAPTASPVFTGDVASSTGNVLVQTIGKGIQVKTGTNAKIGTAVLVGGTVTVANTSVTANSRIFLTSQVDGGTVGFLRVSAKTVGTSFVITSSSVIDTSTVAWYIVESIP